MSYDYSGLRATSQRLIENFGRTMTLRSRVLSGTTYDPTTTDTDTSVTGVVGSFGNYETDGTLILKTDKKFLFASTISPEVKDVIVDGSDVYSAVAVTTINPGDTVLMYQVQGRK